MYLVKNDIWNSIADVILITANSYIKKDGSLTMGKGIALELKNKFPRVEYSFGMAVRISCGHLGKYGVALNTHIGAPEKVYGLFQVKYHFKDRADLNLIKYSTDILIRMLDWSEYLRTNRIAMNYPGIGLGGLSESDVYPIISLLPDNVRIHIK